MTFTIVDLSAAFAVGVCAGIIAYRAQLNWIWKHHKDDIYLKLAAALEEQEGDS